MNISAPRTCLQASLNHWDEAHQDAEKCVELKPDWAKGYSRLGGALYGKRKYQEAIDTYKKGLAIDSGNAALKSGLSDAEKALAGPGRRPPQLILQQPMACLSVPASAAAESGIADDKRVVLVPVFAFHPLAR